MGKPKKSPCEECGAPSGDPHKNTCSRAQKRRRAGNTPLPRPGNQRGQGTPGYGEPCPPHNPKPFKEDANGNTIYRCGRCRQILGKGL